MITYSCSYSPEDNKLRLYATQRLAPDVYDAARKVGFRYAPKQTCFICPAWNPEAEDFALSLCEEISDEDTTLIERSEDRAERFSGYADRRNNDAKTAHQRVQQILENIPLGQPILQNHHSERHARADQRRIEDGTRHAVDHWRRASYWERRAQAAITHAAYKDRPDVRARRIKTLEAEHRHWHRTQTEAYTFLGHWMTMTTMREAVTIANQDHVSAEFSLAEYPREPPASQYEGSRSLWSALTEGICTPAQAQTLAMAYYEATFTRAERWLEHLTNRLVYERTLLEAAGGIVADQQAPMVGGAVSCWVQGGRWIPILKVNKTTVTVPDNYGNGARDFTRTIPFDKLYAVLSPSEWQAHQSTKETV